MLAPWKKSYDQSRKHIKKQRHYFAIKGPSSQIYSFSSSHVWMWELDYKESWTLKNWCIWIVVLEKTLESPLDCKEIQPFNPKGNQFWKFVGRTDAEAETPILWSTNTKNWLTVILFFVCVVNINEPSYQWDPMDCSLSGSFVHGILQARILEWVAIPFFRGSFWARDRTQVSCIAGGFFTV